MKLNYTSIQHATVALEAEPVGARAPTARAAPVAVIALHGQLAPLAWSLGQARPGIRLGYVQTAGGALPGSHSAVARELRGGGSCCSPRHSRPVLRGAGRGRGDDDRGDRPRTRTAGSRRRGLRSGARDHRLRLDARTRRHGGARLGARGAGVGCCRRSSSRGCRPPTRGRATGASRITRATVLELLLAAVTVACRRAWTPPTGVVVTTGGRGRPISTAYAASGLPVSTMGRTLEADPVFFAAGLAGGAVLADM